MSWSRWRTDLALGAGLLGVGVAVLRLFGSAVHAPGRAFGSDAALWGLTAMNLRSDYASFLPPGYPWLVRLVQGERGVLVPEALNLSLGLTIALIPLIWAIARRFGASIEAGVLASLMVLSQPDLILFGLQVQPDGLTTLMLLGAGPVAWWYWCKPSFPRAVGLASWGVATWLVREHGTVLLAIYGLLALVAPGSWRLRGSRVAILLGLMVLAPLAALEPPNFPWKAPWMSRIFMATSGQENIPLPQHATEDVLAPVLAHREAHANHDTLAVLRIHITNNFVRAPYGWLMLFLGLAAAPFVDRKRAVLALPLLTALPTLPILAQPRHVAVVLPGAFIVLGSLIDAPTEGWRAGRVAGFFRQILLFAGLATAGLGMYHQWPGTVLITAEHSSWAEAEQRFAAEICEYSRGGRPTIATDGSPRSWLLYCPLPSHTVQPNQILAADWNTLFVAAEAPGPGWTAVGPQLSYPNEGSTLYLFRLAPWLSGSQRPCSGSHPVEDTPYIVISLREAVMEPPCTW